ncbi:hypothetical protein BSL78_27288, partial [Apostichopus japonicus]
MAYLKEIFAQKGRTGPYSKPLKVCAKAQFQSNLNTDSGSSSKLTVFEVADNSSAAKALVYDEEILVNFIVGSNILIINKAERLANPPPAEHVNLQKKHISPAKKIVSVEGQIISGYTLERPGRKKLYVGDYKEIMNAVTNYFQGETSLSTASRTTISPRELPETTKTTAIIGYEEMQEDGTFLLTCDENPTYRTCE